MGATFLCLHLRLVLSSFLLTTLETSILPSFPSFDLLMLPHFTNLIATFFEYSFCTDPSRVQLRTRSRFSTSNGHSICCGQCEHHYCSYFGWRGPNSVECY
ncbi:hypothetical protein GLYMA_09G215534v4 [Glycine max]|nr:hypothetical protein GLYMA_09G215534v4 [Glycine max]KAH1044137.1 hypothetical protein GYH30_025765 [Glycine max]